MARVRRIETIHMTQSEHHENRSKGNGRAFPREATRPPAIRLSKALEAVRIADEKLKRQDEELAASRALIEHERKTREEAEASNRTKSDFLALLSHEFRTPLQAILGYTELLEREIHGPLNELQQRDVRSIQRSQQHLLGLVNTVLDFAKLESTHSSEMARASTVRNQTPRSNPRASPRSL